MSHEAMRQAMRRHWADPAWRQQQCERLKEGKRKSRERREREAAGITDEPDSKEPWKPGDPKPEWLRRGA